MDKTRVKEADLIENLKPIRFFVIATAIFNFLDNGIHAELLKTKNCTAVYLSEKLCLNKKVLVGLLNFLANEGYLYRSNKEEFSLSPKSQNIDKFKPWYDLLIGGYSETFIQFSSLLKSEKKYASRNSKYIGIGSCGISQFDALPMTLSLINKINPNIDYIIDLGCGDGSYLANICSELKTIQAIGIDPEQKSVEAGNQISQINGLTNRLKFVKGNASDFPIIPNAKNICFITAFVLQEVLEQSGESEIMLLIEKIFSSYPNAHLVVIEVDNKFEDSELFHNSLAKSYYNPYYLLHVLTEQKLENKEYWTKLFEKAGLSINFINYPDSEYDSLKLKMGFLLTKQNKYAVST
jgi:2-ketoarginine methyltransferase